MNNKRVLIFDFDGTLIDSAGDLALAANQMLQQLDREPFAQSQFRQWIGNGARVMVQRALSGSTEVDPNLCPQTLEKALALFFDSYRQNACVNTCLYPGVLDTLTTLKDKGYVLVVATNKPIEFVDPINKALAIDHLFELNLGGDSLPWKKPDPRPLLHICEHFGITVNQAVMVGDSKNDILAAVAADMQSIGVTYGYNYGEDIGVYNPTHKVDHFDQILSLL